MRNGLDAVLEIGPSPVGRIVASQDGGSGMEQGERSGSALALLFAPGERPDADRVAQVIAASRANGLPASVSHRPVGAADWLELLASGLTFDLLGLAPGAAGSWVGPAHAFGFDEAPDPQGLEAVSLLPAGHIASGAALQPVVRTLMGLASNLALDLPVRAVVWEPAQTVMEPRYFCRSVLNWLAGGAFPALGLTALLRGQDGSLATRGLAHFTGQEMQLEGRADETPADAARLAVRVIDHLVRHGRVVQPARIDAGENVLIVEPSQVGRLVLVWREEKRRGDERQE